MNNRAREIAERSLRRQLPSAAYPSSTWPRRGGRPDVAAFKNLVERDTYTAQLRREKGE
jgi:hypothetical protein